MGVASLDLFREENVIFRVQRLEKQLREGLEPLRSLSSVGDIRVLGGVGVIELVSDRKTKAAGGYLDQVGPRLASAFLEKGLLIRPLGNLVYFMPPYVITESEVAWVLETLANVLKQVTPE